MKSVFRYSLRATLLAAVLMISHLAFCWGLTGHRIIGEIAESHLSSKAKKEIKKLFGRESLAWWSNWPDFIKSDSTWNHASHWHYIDLPGHISREEFITGLKKLPGKNLYTQIQDMVAQLKDKSLPLKQRQEALRFLVHMVGDLHQPLHVGRDEDQGGNKIVVYWFDKKTNLHTLWDSMFIEFQQYSYTEYAKLLNIASKEDVKKWQSGTLEDWFYDSHVVSDKIYDATPPESKLSYKYNFQFQQTLEEQLLKGGLRLAAVLNAAFE
ncbi:S1/P1 nuclease [Terrimonas sp. NA20]|uniref:S1/P1 nuclease n=1 Tax=Terrimonas ginsenosidimutans TaxID=2908004 RepID=A0ABS9KTM2_9BACT|nr:S1/P1 nuclease [Terrimonas ginsenosidimutans]MCG2615656.1 S1/P1 nuclease [Terrimonas ginsenosidimutans]